VSVRPAPGGGKVIYVEAHHTFNFANNVFGEHSDLLYSLLFCTVYGDTDTLIVFCCTKDIMGGRVRSRI
jgi:hypothetical protein